MRKDFCSFIFANKQQELCNTTIDRLFTFGSFLLNRYLYESLFFKDFGSSFGTKLFKTFAI